ncbi:hypothetical protein LTR23_003533 [Exophiala sp. CCFEE 6169]|nr:hypothetical protein LTR23_003533 [Chaetothyriales sp. CCFEE 6169]
MWRLLATVLALFSAGAAYFLTVLYKKRRELDGLPQPPMTSTFWGHLPLAGECKRLFPPQTHVQNWSNYIRKKYQLGDVFYVDWWPLGPRWLFVADPELASKYITTGQSLRKSHLTTNYLTKLLGRDNMVGLEGQQWKVLRSIFNPGFSASHLISLVPLIVDSTLVFLDILREKAQSGELISLDTYSTRYTIDIIGKIVMDTDFHAQTGGGPTGGGGPHPIVTTFRRQVDLMPSATSVGPLDDINLGREVRLWWNMRKLDSLIGAEIDERVAARRDRDRNRDAAPQTEQAQGSSNTSTQEKSEKKRSFSNRNRNRNRNRSVIELALDAYDQEAATATTTATAGDARGSESKNKSKTSPNGTSTSTSARTQGAMNSSFRALAIDSIKTFIFAGHDTTSATISYAMYLLHLHKDVHAKLVAELNRVYSCSSSPEASSGKGTTSTASTTAAAEIIAQRIISDPHSINKLEYMTAVIKEVLRLFPPASTLRELLRPLDIALSKDTVMPAAAGKSDKSDKSDKSGKSSGKPGSPGKKSYPLAGFHIWPVAHMIHRNESYFPDPVKFVPERFIPSQTPYPHAKLHTPAGKDAWRPFEKGPRNCIGQELAMIETKIALALLVNDLDFTAEYAGAKIESWTPVETIDEFKDGKPGVERLTIEGHKPYQVLHGAARPKDGMTGRLSLRS